MELDSTKDHKEEAIELNKNAKLVNKKLSYKNVRKKRNVTDVTLPGSMSLGSWEHTVITLKPSGKSLSSMCGTPNDPRSLRCLSAVKSFAQRS